jgi:hypothetical protein
MSRSGLEALLALPPAHVATLSLTARRRLAASPRTQPPALDVLWRDPDARVRAALARNGRLKPMAVTLVATDAHPLVREAIASRRRLESDVVARLAGDAFPGVRMALARRRGLPWPILERLLSDTEPSVRVTAAVFHTLPAALIARFATSTLLSERQVAAASARLGPDLQLVLANDPSWQVRRLLLLCHRPRYQSLEVLTALAPAPEIAGDAFASRRLLEHLQAGLKGVAPSDTPRALIVALMRSPAPLIREAGRRLAYSAHAARTQ